MSAARNVAQLRRALVRTKDEQLAAGVVVVIMEDPDRTRRGKQRLTNLGEFMLLLGMVSLLVDHRIITTAFASKITDTVIRMRQCDQGSV